MIFPIQNALCAPKTWCLHVLAIKSKISDAVQWQNDQVAVCHVWLESAKTKGVNNKNSLYLIHKGITQEITGGHIHTHMLNKDDTGTRETQGLNTWGV